MNQIKKSQKIQAEFSRAASRYDNDSFVHRNVAKYLISHSPHLLGKLRIIDIGSGTGIVSEQITGLCHEEQITNFDLSSTMLEVCQRKFPASTYVQGDMGAMTIQNTFDYVVSSTSLQWLEEVDLIVDCIQKCLTPGGRFAVSVVLRGTFDVISKIREGIVEQRVSYEAVEFSQSHRLPEYQALRGAFEKHSSLVCERSEKHLFTQVYENINDPFKAIKNLGIAGYSRNPLSCQEFSLLLKQYGEHLLRSNLKPYLDYQIGFFWGRKSKV